MINKNKSNLSKLIYYILIIIISILAATYCNAGYNIKDLNEKVRIGELPDFCFATIIGSADEAKKQKYYDYYGPIFGHVHHYCYAIDKINTYRKTNDKKVLRSSIFEFDYVLAKEDPKNRINYKIAFAKGRVLLLLNENPEDKNEAMKSFYLSIKLNNRYSKAYIAISNMYLENGNVEMAMKILKQGLEKNPQSKNLKAAINKIGKH